MSGPFYDFDDNEPLFPAGEGFAFDMKGNFMMRISDNLAVDMSSGDIHYVSDWTEGEDGEDGEDDF